MNQEEIAAAAAVGPPQQQQVQVAAATVETKRSEGELPQVQDGGGGIVQVRPQQQQQVVLPPNPPTGINFSQSLESRLASLLETGALADVEFLVGEEETSIKAHKLVIAISSPVFYSMFFGPLPSEDVVRVPDSDPTAFRTLLSWVYGSRTSVLIDNTGETQEARTVSVLYLAHKYDIKALEEICASRLLSVLNSWNCLAILGTAQMYCLEDLGSKCWALLQANTRSVLNFHQHSIDYHTLLRVVKDDCLTIEEVKLFEFLNTWAENECEKEDLVPTVDNKLRRLGETIAHVRFPTMTASDFANRVAPKGLLSDEQVAKVLTYICSSPQNRLFLRVDFPTTQRKDPHAVGDQDGYQGGSSTPRSNDTAFLAALFTAPRPPQPHAHPQPLFGGIGFAVSQGNAAQPLNFGVPLFHQPQIQAQVFPPQRRVSEHGVYGGPGVIMEPAERGLAAGGGPMASPPRNNNNNNNNRRQQTPRFGRRQ